MIVLANSAHSVDDIGMHLLVPAFPLTPVYKGRGFKSRGPDYPIVTISVRRPDYLATTRA